MPAWWAPIVWLVLVGGCVGPATCNRAEQQPWAPAPDATAEAIAPRRELFPARDPGRPIEETDKEVDAARAESAQLVGVLARSGVAAREVASMADIRGYRYYRQRRFHQAQIWFEAAVTADSTYEPALFNAARVASLLQQVGRARRYLALLGERQTPLSHRLVTLAERDPDLQQIHPSTEVDDALRHGRPVNLGQNATNKDGGRAEMKR